GVVERMSHCVRGQAGQSGSTTPLQSPEQGVIDRASRTLKNRHGAERKQRTPRLDFRLVESWYKIGLIDIDRSYQLRTFIADVAYLEQPVLRTLALITQSQVLNVGT